MKIYAGLIILFGALFVAAQDACEDNCDKIEADCRANHLGGCGTNRATCHGECLRAKCLRKSGMDFFGHQEKCGCHADCSASHCQDGVCCLPPGYGANSDIMCCSKKAREVPINIEGYSKECT